MKNFVLAVRDSAMGAFMRPILVPAIGIGIRSFADEVNRKDENNGLNRHPSDYELWSLAEFDDETGRYTQNDETMRCIQRGKDVIQS